MPRSDTEARSDSRPDSRPDSRSDSRSLPPGLRVRPARDADLPAIQAIYAHHVLHGLASFEETPPSVEEMAARRTALLQRGLHYLVAETDGRIEGYCYAGLHHARSGYRYTLEDSVYVAPERAGRGIGSALLPALIAQCERGPWRQMVAIIGDSGNAASIALHRRCGFVMSGTLRSVGFKLGRWVDTVTMQRALGRGDADRPA